jgi:hypothetical protein
LIEKYCRKSSPCGNLSVVIGIADFSFEFINLDERIKTTVSEIYRFFLINKTDGTVTVEVGRLIEKSESASDDFELVCGDGGSCLIAPYFAGARAEDLSSYFLHLIKEDEKSVVFAFENFLRWMISEMAVQKGGLLLHASAKVVEGEALVFLGNHESGKSTAVSLIQPGFTIADDVLLVLPHGECFNAYTMPAATKFDQKESEVSSYPVSGIYNLHKSEANGVQACNKVSAYTAVVASIPFLQGVGDNRKLFIARNIIDRLNVYELYFTKEPKFFEEAWKRGIQDGR